VDITTRWDVIGKISVVEGQGCQSEKERRIASAAEIQSLCQGSYCFFVEKDAILFYVGQRVESENMMNDPKDNPWL
jgi:hypothetical protein